MANVIETGNAFVNPYNFVPFSSSAPVRKSYDDWSKDQKVMTGHIECELKIVTPLAIPDSEHKKEDEKVPHHYHYAFMRRDPDDDSTAFIPGSEIRGMIRSMYEAATDSCLSILEDSGLTGRSHSFSNKKYGLIRKEGNQWYLYDTRTAYLQTFGNNPRFQIGFDEERASVYVTQPGDAQRYYQGSLVSFEYETENTTRRDIIQKLGRGNSKGYLLIGEKGLNASGKKGHKYSHVMRMPGAGTKGIPLKHGEAEALEDVIKYYQDKTINNAYKKGDGTHLGYRGLRVSKTDFTPVFYTEIGGHYLLSPAMQGREVYGASLRDFVGGYYPCLLHGESEICAACALFGTIGDEAAYGSRVRFTDAQVQTLPLFEKEVQLKELSSPKVSATEFYTEWTNTRTGERPGTWNYLYQKKGKAVSPINQGQLHMRGRKFYLHHDSRNLRYRAAEQDKSDRNSTVELATSGTFHFRVYFDRITQRELDYMVWCLSPWRKHDGQEEPLYQKLGHGKSLGLGSVRITIPEEPSVRMISGNLQDGLSYKLEKVPAHSEETEKEIQEAFKNMLAIDVPLVQYPAAHGSKGSKQNIDAGHQWFSMNKKIDGTGAEPAVKYVLPYVPVRSVTSAELGKALQLPELTEFYNPSPVKSVVNPAYQVPQKSVWANAKPASVKNGGSADTSLKSEPGNATAAPEAAVTIGSWYSVPVKKVVPEKHAVYCIMPDGREGFLPCFGKMPTMNDHIYVQVKAEDTVHNNWKLGK